ncbi:hypothetical protein BU24DRAFT_41920 [Aaosphaeria arxii CBS 175.79]|uniref:Uncharacterized protein n=1 Tax=Aaosphaeria arxii CBS 175.79 TaxID=1450172 RepID=A0A6A5YA25_9PLEO|nr:uncharacterized protein BU24DRAFT_41920 [Aaosphaeria arxii CBS 175.79]KAF2022288.1 hypothetical protein BU24DRAFT_41920 [Aaosphaeria arxii CBS 175.79]
MQHTAPSNPTPRSSTRSPNTTATERSSCGLLCGPYHQHVHHRQNYRIITSLSPLSSQFPLVRDRTTGGEISLHCMHAALRRSARSKLHARHSTADHITSTGGRMKTSNWTQDDATLFSPLQTSNTRQWKCFRLQLEPFGGEGRNTKRNRGPEKRTI